MLKPMLPELGEIPSSKGWKYEIKYDGFRALLYIDENTFDFKSRNGNDLSPIFPEVYQFYADHKDMFLPYLPLQLDGELVMLLSPYHASFSKVQQRGRMRAKEKIKTEHERFPCSFLVFDLLMLKGEDIRKQKYPKRKVTLEKLFKDLELPLQPSPGNPRVIQLIPSYSKLNEVWNLVRDYDGEGIVGKSEKSVWEEGKRTSLWVKDKNWIHITAFITRLDSKNGYYYIGVLDADHVVEVGYFYFGISKEEKDALNQIIKQNTLSTSGSFYFVEPAICVEVKFLEKIADNELREPHFVSFRLDLKPADCTLEKFRIDLLNLPHEVEVTHPDKPLWEGIDKVSYLGYMREIYGFIQPFIKDRLLTVIRYPHGIKGESFYQKNCPDYAPDFINTVRHEDIDYIICNDLRTYMWLGNQLAFEFHVPFNTIHENGTSEIVFDLDPPSRDYFQLAVKAAALIKQQADQLHLHSFIKTSGNKGLQVYIPLPRTYSYDDTAIFMEFLARSVLLGHEDIFTIERLKKNRGNRLYLDYIQHGKGKTIVAPYSVRGNEEGLVATPLFWDEVNQDLTPKAFTMDVVRKRIRHLGCPFWKFDLVREEQPFDEIIEFLKKQV
ncbi:DNA ligase D [Bacillus litorisediminis]|uniref:DNA ligase D n=1 Tax=Bacillus litorisediminis TaxID=2922713 RepID=UPI001FADAA54|nr:DNA ligase D [Bacillus litorisediminis]